MAEVKGEISVKAGNGKGFIVSGVEGWFNCADATLLAKFNKGDKVVVTYDLDGKQKKVSMISSDGLKPSLPPAIPKTADVPPPAEVKKEAPKTSSTGFACEVCGKELKDGKYKKCYDCNQKKATTQASEEQKAPDTTTGPKCPDCGKALKDDKYEKCFECNKKNPSKKKWGGKGGSYKKSPEEVAQIQKGNALNAAAAVLSGADCLQGQTPEGIAEMTKIVANSLLEYLKIE